MSVDRILELVDVGLQSSAEPVPDDDWDDYVDFDDEDPEPNCQTCCGDGFEFCEDWDCWEGDCDGEWHTCPNCHGSGRAKDQWFW